MSTTPDYAGLIERLETRCSYGDARLTNPHDALSAEAAFALRTLLERNAALERERDDWESRFWRRDEQADKAYLRAEAAEAKLAEAMKVIEPFATAADNFDGFKISDPREWFAYGGSSNAAGNDRSGSISVADIRAARKFLKENGNGE